MRPTHIATNVAFGRVVKIIITLRKMRPPSIGKPVRAMLEVEITDKQGKVANAWPFWLFPR